MMIIINKNVLIEVIIFISKRGNKITNSVSKIRKIMVIIKNRIEKGDFDFFKGLNPHSNGLFFVSLLIFISLKIIKVICKIKIGIIGIKNIIIISVGSILIRTSSIYKGI